MILKGGTNISGVPIGILCLETYYGRPPGHLRNASTFRFPVMYRIVKGATAKRVVKEADSELLAPFIAAARELEQEGVMAVTGSCGFLALFQDELADSVNIPLFTSSLIQIPMVYRMLHEDGWFFGSSTGINLCAAVEVANKLGPGKTIVTMLCDDGSKYQSRLFNAEFLAEKGLQPP